jgi:cation diffusion facilitator CzcD-associated flavoprotein CzcO
LPRSRIPGGGHPRYLIFAAAANAIPIRPDAPGLDSFGGATLHSGEYTTGYARKRRKVLVMATGNSGHDVAQDLHANGALVTMNQRSTTFVVNLEQAQTVHNLHKGGSSGANSGQICDVRLTWRQRSCRIISAIAVRDDRSEHEPRFFRSLRIMRSAPSLSRLA